MREPIRMLLETTYTFEMPKSYHLFYDTMCWASAKQVNLERKSGIVVVLIKHAWLIRKNN